MARRRARRHAVGGAETARGDAGKAGEMTSGAGSFEYIVVGAGSAGCVVAARLGQRARTLLVEAGGPDAGTQNGEDVGALISQPDQVMRLIWATPIPKPYATEPESHLGGRSIAVHQGVVRGGSHSVNGMIYMRGNRRDYDAWAQLGNEGWS
ncbi:MAG TPA: GMC family oxidoreductase N-terminal domain-containing protein, partial [Candidatus Methylomirabilis sp.]|nr:GMC family oxidoreductase N-terminal domain-containing protein [Candidatus Methylomirabilis sp.]